MTLRADFEERRVGVLDGNGTERPSRRYALLLARRMSSFGAGVRYSRLSRHFRGV